MTNVQNNSADCSGKGLLPIHGKKIDVLILGSFPSSQSLLKNQYYGNPRNQFWQIIDCLFQIDHHLPYIERISRLAGHGTALWDVVSACCRKGSADIQIRNPVLNDISGFLCAFPTPRLIVLNGSTAGRYYHQVKVPPPVHAIILPSTSPANTRYTLAEKVKAWEVILAPGTRQTAIGQKSASHVELQEDHVIESVETTEHCCGITENRNPRDLLGEG